MNDIDKLNWIITIALLPFLLSLLWVIGTTLSVPTALIMAGSVVIGLLVTLHPRVRHYWKALREFENSYCYEPKEGSA